MAGLGLELRIIVLLEECTVLVVCTLYVASGATCVYVLSSTLARVLSWLSTDQPSSLDGVILSLSAVWQASAREIKLVETGRILANNKELSFGNVIDIIVDLQCVGDGDEPSDWFRRFPFIRQLPRPLDPTVTSYDRSSGFLRLLSPFLQDQDNIDMGLISIQCVRDSRAASVDFRPGERLQPLLHLPSPIVPSRHLPLYFPFSTSLFLSKKKSRVCSSTTPSLPRSPLSRPCPRGVPTSSLTSLPPL